MDKMRRLHWEIRWYWDVWVVGIYWTFSFRTRSFVVLKLGPLHIGCWFWIKARYLVLK